MKVLRRLVRDRLVLFAAVITGEDGLQILYTADEDYYKGTDPAREEKDFEGDNPGMNETSHKFPI